jgi:ribosome-associated protein
MQMTKETELQEDALNSKSQVKRDAAELVKLGKAIAALSANQFDAMPLGDVLRDALRESRKLSKGGAIKRQFKYIGKLLRDTDVDELYLAVEKQLDKDRAATSRLHGLEQWRDRLTQDGDVALSAFLEQHPNADRQHLRQLQRKARQELEKQKPPVAARKIFHYIRDLAADI